MSSFECDFCAARVDPHAKGNGLPCMFAWWTREQNKPVFSVGLYCIRPNGEGCHARAANRGQLHDMHAERWSWDHVQRVLEEYRWNSPSRRDLLSLSADVLGSRAPLSLASTKPAYTVDANGVADWTTPTDRRIEFIARQREQLADGEADALVFVYERLRSAQIVAKELFGDEAEPHVVLHILDALERASK